MTEERIEYLIEAVEQIKSIVTELSKAKQQEAEDLCEGTTGKGTPCRNKKVDGQFCRMHSNKGEKRKAPKSDKVAAKKKIQPEHTHGEDASTPCTLCETQGDIMDPTLPKQEFKMETTDDIDAKLKKLLEM
jgi:hypothetical protein